MSKHGRVVTQRDIARESGVSQQLVSAVLRGGGSARCSSSTRLKVEAAMSRLGYRPNRLARHLHGGRHGAYGLLVWSVHFIAPPLLKALLEEAKRRGLLLLIENLPSSGSGGLTLLEEDCVDGLLVFEDLPGSVTERIDGCGLACAWVNTNRGGLPGSVVFDESSAVSSLVSAMLARGRRRIGFVGNALPGRPGHYSELERLSSLRGHLSSSGLPPPPVLRFRHTHPARCSEEMAESARRFLLDRPDLDGLVLQGDLLAPSLYEGARRAGRRVGGDLSVCSFNDSDLASLLWPGLSSLAVDPVALAARVFDRLEALSAGRGAELKPLVVSYTLSERDSI